VLTGLCADRTAQVDLETFATMFEKQQRRPTTNTNQTKND
jgi:hypothetical protein